MSDVIEILKIGKNRLLTEGWCQFSIIDTSGKHCVLGAIMYGDDTSLHVAAAAALRKTLRTRGDNRSVACFNDAPDRAKEEVIELFNDTISVLEEMTLPGKSKTVTVEPLKITQPAPMPYEPKAPVVVPDREKVPA